MKDEMIKRYIYAVTKNLPHKIRGDIEEELKSLIEDMLEERCINVLATEHDIQIVLTSLGSPNELAEKYSPDGSRCLIGPPYYRQYKFVLKIVLISIGLGLSVSEMLTMIFETNAPWYLAFLEWLSMVMMGMAYGFAVVTGIFAFFQWKGIKIYTGGDAVINLPKVPQEKEAINKWEPIIGIVFSVIFSVIFLATPQFIGVFVFTKDLYLSIPVFNSDVMHSLWYIIIGFSALGIIRESYKLYEGRYTIRLMLVTLVTDFLTIALTFLFLFNNRILNPALVLNIGSVFEDDSGIFMKIFENFNLFFLLMITFVLVIDMAATTIKSLKYA